MKLNNWVFELRYVIYTTLKTKLTRRFGAIYPELFITDSPISVDEAKFPTIYLREIGSPERSRDLEGNYINAVDSTWQSEVVMQLDDASEAMDIAQYINELFKDMCFRVTVTANVVADTSLVRIVSRFNRYISANDTL